MAVKCEQNPIFPVMKIDPFCCTLWQKVAIYLHAYLKIILLLHRSPWLSVKTVLSNSLGSEGSCIASCSKSNAHSAMTFSMSASAWKRVGKLEFDWVGQLVHGHLYSLGHLFTIGRCTFTFDLLVNRVWVFVYCEELNKNMHSVFEKYPPNMHSLCYTQKLFVLHIYFYLD